MTTTIPAGWLPIESAPKDSFIFDGLHHYGTKIIVFDGSINTARWWRIEGDSASNFIDEGGRAIYPTHWMPLPAAPGVSTVEESPAAGDALDAARLDWLERHDGRFYNKDRISSIVGTGFLVAGDEQGIRHQTVRAAIDAAIAAQRKGDA